MRRLRPCLVVLGVLSLGLLVAGCGGSHPTPPVVVPPPPPPPPATATAAFTAPATAAPNTPVAFDASASKSSDGSALQYVWDFGNAQRGGGVKIARAFAAAGPQSVALTVTDGAGRSATVTHTVTISSLPAASGSVSAQGFVQGLDGAPLAGVTLAVVGGSASGVTDATGTARLAVDRGVPTVIKLTRDGYADQFLPLVLPAAAGADAYFEAVMRPRDAALPLADAAAGGTVTGRDGAVLTLPAGALVDSTGAAISGPVSIAMTPVDPTQPGGGGFPGSFDGAQTDGVVTPIVSYGTVEYVLSAGSSRLQIAPGKTATIEIPMYAGTNADGTAVVAGGTTPLWSLDEATGLWVEEGQGTIVASASSPTGFALRATVSHFTWWNSDLGFDPNLPKAKCVYDTDIGLPGGQDTFATATICNMLAQFDRGPAPAAVGSRARAAAVPRPAPAATLSAAIVGYSRRFSVSIIDGLEVPVPPNVNIVMSATALNGSWVGSTIVNGPSEAHADALIKMHPLASTGPGAEPVTPPLDTTRSLDTAQTALYSFTGVPYEYARVTVTSANQSSLVGRVRLLSGTTELASTVFSANPGTFTVLMADTGPFTIEVTGIAGTPGAYELQLDIPGGTQSASLVLPFDVTVVLPFATTYQGTFSIPAPGAAVFSYARAGNGHDPAFSIVAPDGTTLPGLVPLGFTQTSATVALPLAGSYAIHLASDIPVQDSFHIAGEATQWVDAAPLLDTDSIYAIADIALDHNGVPVIGYTVPGIGAGQAAGRLLKLSRWTGTAWETVGADLQIDGACVNSSSPVIGFAFDATNTPYVAYGSSNTPPATGSLMSVRRFSGGSWQAVGPGNGALPNVSASSGACNGANPAIAFAADGAPLLAYGMDNSVYVQRFDGTTWSAATTTSTDTFAAQQATFALGADPAGQIFLVIAEPYGTGAPTTVRRLATGTSPATWAPVGPNGGTLPQPATFGAAAPQLRFDAAGLPVVAARVAVGSANSTSSAAGVFAYDGSQWTSSGGHVATANSYISNGDVSAAIYGGVTYVAWQDSNPVTPPTGPVVQTYSGTAWTPVGADIGEIPQLTQHGLVQEYGGVSKLLASGSGLYLAIVGTDPHLPRGGPKLRLLRKVGTP